MHVLLTVNDVKGERNEIDVKGKERWQWEQDAGARSSLRWREEGEEKGEEKKKM